MDEMDFAAERAIAIGLSPRIAWPTLAFGILLPIGHWALVALALTGVIDMWLLMPLLGFTAYMHYSLIHEAIHRNIVRQSKAFEPFNQMFGWIGCLPLGMTWPQLEITHLQHHQYTNTERDPDYFLKGSYRRLLGIWLVSIVANLLPVPWVKWAFDKLKFESGYLNIRRDIGERNWQIHLIVHTASCAFVWGMIALGYAAEVIALYVLPASFGRLLLGTFQQWLPHAPFTESSRYRKARVMKVPLGPLWFMGHDVHTVHHLWPSVPFYAYGALFRQLEPKLRANGVRIEGLVPRQHAPVTEVAAQG